MKKIVIIYRAVEHPNGGSQCINRNIDSIKEIYGEKNTFLFSVSGNCVKSIGKLFSRLWNILNGYYCGLDNRQVQAILTKIELNKIDDIYIDGSFYGKLAKIIKRRFPNVRVYTFFHNCEYEYAINSVSSNKRYWQKYNILLAYKNEKQACKYSDKIIALNDRDKIAIERYYCRTPEYIIPITFKPWYNPQNYNKSIKRPLHALFVGSYFYGNIMGLRWFCENVLPNVNIHLSIVGSGMEMLLSEINPSDKVEIHGKVSDLTNYYENADFVVLPILSGGGMKVKTAESLMFGKYIVGTSEAFTGYDINNSVASVCNTAEEFINTLNTLSIETKFNKASRDLFEEKYSYQTSLRIFKSVFI